MTIIYIHGFRSDSKTSKVQRLKDLFPEDTILTANFDPNPTKCFQQIFDLVAHWVKDYPVHFMGTSLGGFFALYSAIKFESSSLCINPSLKPQETLKVGEYTTYNLGLEYNLTEEDLSEYKEWSAQILHDLTHAEYFPHLVKLAFNEDDEVIHHSLCEEYKRHVLTVYYPTGGHRATNFEQIVKDHYGA